MKARLRWNLGMCLLAAWILFTLLTGCGTSGEEDGDIGDGEDSAGAVELFRASVDGEAVVFLARGDETSTPLSDPLVDGGNVVDFAISPDGQYVAYKADQESKGLFELFSVPITGGAVVNVSRQINSNPLRVINFAWAPDGSRIAFTAQSDLTAGDVDLFTNQPRGNNPLRVSISLPVGGEVRDFLWSPNTNLLVYAASIIGGSPNRFELFSTRPGSQDNNNISGFLPISSSVGAFAWAPTEDLVAFLADSNTGAINELLVTDPTVVSPTPIAVSGTLVNGGEVLFFRWAPDSSRIAYLADQFEDEKFELISVFPDVNNPLLPDIDLRRISARDLKGDVTQFAWAPDSSLIAYIADQVEIGKFELFTNDKRGTDNQKVSGPIVNGGDVIFFKWEPVEQADPFILYLASQDDANIFELFTTTPGGAGGDKKVSGEPMAGTVRETADAFAWSPGTDSISYIAGQEDPATDELFSTIPDPVLPDPRVGVKINDALTAGGNVESFRWSPDSEFIAYRADQDTFNVFELYASKPDGSDNRKISGDLLPGGQVLDKFEWVP